MNIDIKDRDQMFSKLIDSVELKEEEDEWSIVWKKACDDLFSTMVSEHAEHVVKGLKKMREERETGIKREYDNLTDEAVKMLFFHCYNKIHKPDQKLPLYLPPHIAKIYLEDIYATALPLCNICGYWYPGKYFKDCPYCDRCF